MNSILALCAVEMGLALCSMHRVQPVRPVPGQCCETCVNGVVTHGDGHRTECPCPPDCKCKKPKSVLVPSVATPVFEQPCETESCPLPQQQQRSGTKRIIIRR